MDLCTTEHPTRHRRNKIQLRRDNVEIYSDSIINAEGKLIPLRLRLFVLERKQGNKPDPDLACQNPIQTDSPASLS